MTDQLEFRCPGEVYAVSAVICRERQRRGWGKCRVCKCATLEEIVSIQPAPQAEEKAEIRRRRYYLLR